MECAMWDFNRFGEDGRNKTVEPTLNLRGCVGREGGCSCARVEACGDSSAPLHLLNAGALPLNPSCVSGWSYVS